MEEDQERSKTLPCITAGCPVRILPSDNIFDISCIGCSANYCVKCSHPPHFPITCEERLRWEYREFEDDPYLQARVKLYESYIASLNKISKDLEYWNRDFQKRCFQQLQQFAHLPILNLSEEMEKITCFCRWLYVLSCFTPRVESLTKDSHLLLTNECNLLYAAYPSPASTETWNDFIRPRVRVAEAMVRLLTDVHRAGLEGRMLHGSYEKDYVTEMAIAFAKEISHWKKVCPPEEKVIRFTLDKWDSVASWEVDSGPVCSIYKSLVEGKCTECLATQTIEECPLVRGVCNHTFHVHCISPWLQQHNTCPLDMREWQAHGN